MKTLFVCSLVALLFAACGKADDPSSDSSDGGGSDSGSKSTPVDADQPWEDLSKPYLDDKKMGNFVKSLEDPKGPFDAIAKGKVSAFNSGAVMDEFDAAARKCGFGSGAEYFGVWTRLNAINTQIIMDDSNQSMIKMHEETIKQHQETLKSPGLTAEQKQSLEGQITGSQQTIAALKQPRESGVNAKDVEVFKKHKAAFEE
ncbi:MAG TPA: hypothetical protein VJU16_03200, partial [Planctomycetota bacterium]|nr:hypothetical protein [Planctomycetota bacterium]